MNFFFILLVFYTCLFENAISEIQKLISKLFFLTHTFPPQRKGIALSCLT